MLLRVNLESARHDFTSSKSLPSTSCLTLGVILEEDVDESVLRRVRGKVWNSGRGQVRGKVRGKVAVRLGYGLL